MGFGKQKAPARVSAARLNALAGASPSVEVEAAGPRPRVSVEPDLSRINKNRIVETPEERKKRLAAKTVNFGATFIARIIIIAAACAYGYDLYQSTGAVHRGVAAGVLAMIVDFGRVLLKAMEPGSK